MDFIFTNITFIAIGLVVFLFLTTLFHSIRYFRNRKLIINAKFLIFCRVVAIFIIVVLFLHPILYMSRNLPESNHLDIYIDNSKSMQKNIGIDSTHVILENINNWALDKGYTVTSYLIGNSVRLLDDSNSLTFDDKGTNFDLFRKNVIESQSDHFLLITDGLSPIGEKPYSFGKKINILGIGEEVTKTTEFDEAYLLSKDSKVFLNLSSNNMFLDAKLQVRVFQDDILLSFYEINAFSDTDKYLNEIDISHLDLKDYRNMKIIINDSKQIFRQELNILNRMKSEAKSVLLISGLLSSNTRYIKDRLENIDYVHVELNYKINNQWNKEADSPYDNFEMIIFDNYPNSNKDWHSFLKTVNDSKKLGIPMIFISGADQDYKMLKKIEDLYPITFLKESVEQRLKTNKNYTEDYDLSDFYIGTDSSLFSIKCGLEDERMICLFSISIYLRLHISFPSLTIILITFLMNYLVIYIMKIRKSNYL